VSRANEIWPVQGQTDRAKQSPKLLKVLLSAETNAAETLSI
jgi:hypothetical protein